MSKRKNARVVTEQGEEFDNIFEALGFETEEAAVLEAKVSLMIELEKCIKGMTQVKAAGLLGTSQSRISEMKKGNFKNISLDKMFQMVARTGLSVKISLVPTDTAPGR